MKGRSTEDANKYPEEDSQQTPVEEAINNRLIGLER